MRAKDAILKIVEYVKNRVAYLKVHIGEDDYRYKLQLIVVSFVLAIVSFGMCVLNIVTKKTILTIATGSFSALSIAVLFLARFNKTFWAKIILGSGIVALLFYFLITGGTDGFSPMWILMLPACGFLVLGLKMGSTISVIMFLLCVIFLWTPLKYLNIMYEYTDTFRMRFPLVYIAFLAVGLIFELIRHLTNSKLIVTNSKLISANKMITELAKSDSLTGLFNRMAFNETVGEIINDPKSYALLMIDVDKFKQYNDTYGHLAGDGALKKVAECLCPDVEGATAYRFGGEEFITLFPCADESVARKMATEILTAVQKQNIIHDNSENGIITVSIGLNVGIIDSIQAVESLIRGADSALYQAKAHGRNRVELISNKSID